MVLSSKRSPLFGVCSKGNRELGHRYGVILLIASIVGGKPLKYARHICNAEAGLIATCPCKRVHIYLLIFN